MEKIRRSYNWFISNEKPLMALVMVNMAVIVHFLGGVLSYWPVPWWWWPFFSCVGGCIGFLVGLLVYFFVILLIKVGVVDPDTSK